MRSDRDIEETAKMFALSGKELRILGIDDLPALDPARRSILIANIHEQRKVGSRNDLLFHGSKFMAGIYSLLQGGVTLKEFANLDKKVQLTCANNDGYILLCLRSGVKIDKLSQLNNEQLQELVSLLGKDKLSIVYTYKKDAGYFQAVRELHEYIDNAISNKNNQRIGKLMFHNLFHRSKQSEPDYDKVVVARELLILNDPLLKSSNKLNDIEKLAYITNFLEKTSSPILKLSFGYENAESVMQRLQSIHGLSELTNQPVMLLISLYVLPYLEKFYAAEQGYQPIQVLRRDLLHLFTCLFDKDEEQKLLSRYRNLNLEEIPIKDEALEYIITIAKLLSQRKTGITIEELCSHFEVEYFNQEINEKTDEAVLLLSCLHQASFLLIKEEGSNSYQFAHEVFRDYFAVLTPDAIRGRRKKIDEFLDRLDLRDKFDSTADSGNSSPTLPNK